MNAKTKTIGPIAGAIVAIIVALIGAQHIWDRLIKPKGSIAGSVKDADTNKPILGAKVMVRNAEFITGESGEYMFKLKFGKYTVSASAKNYVQDEKAVTINSDNPVAGDADLKLELEKTIIEGFVKDADTDKPIFGDVVTGGLSTKTDESGRYELKLKPGDHTVSASAEKYISQDQQVTVELNKPMTLDDFKLEQKQGILMGTITDDKNHTISNAIVRAKGITGTNVAIASSEYQFSLKPGEYVVSARAYKYEAQDKQITVKSGETAKLNFIMKPSSLHDKWVTVESHYAIKVEWQTVYKVQHVLGIPVRLPERLPLEKEKKGVWPPEPGWVIVDAKIIPLAPPDNGKYSWKRIAGGLNITTEQDIRSVYNSAIDVAAGNGQEEIAAQLETEMHAQIKEVADYSGSENTLSYEISAKPYGYALSKETPGEVKVSVQALIHYVGRPGRDFLIAELEERYGIDI